MLKLFPVLLIARGALVLAAALFAAHVSRRVSASLRYSVLAAALAAVLVLPAIERVVPVWHTGALAEGGAPIASFDLPVAETAAPAAVTAAPALAPGQAPASSSIPWLGGIWLLGAAALLLRTSVGAWRARGIARRGAPVRGVGVMEVWRSLDGRSDPPRIVASDEIEAPIVVGAIAPVVVVPRASAEWTAERWRVVLLHELAHVRRRDGLANLVAQLACCLHWVNPLAWIAARRMREERELAADDAVLRTGQRASTYAEHLIAIATAAPSAAPVAVLGMAEPSRFEARVVALLDADRSRRPAGRRALAVTSIAALVTAAAACFSPESPPVKSGDDGVGSVPALAKDPALQGAAEAELDAVMTAHRASGAIAIVLDARTGAPLVVATRGEGDARAARTPGSTMKPFTFAAALEAGVVDGTTRIDCEHGERRYGDKVLRDASPNGVLDLGGILAVSSNVCTAKLVEKLDGERYVGALQRYHLAPPAHIDTHSFEGAAIGFGEGIRISALDLASAYTAIADGGVYHARDGRSERAMSEAAARTVLALLERPVTDPAGTAGAARIEGIRVAGKTGTVNSSGGYYASFVGIVPADAPRFVVLVGVDGVEGQGGKVAAPVFAKIAARALSPQRP